METKHNGHAGKIEKLVEITKNMMPSLQYHNFPHALDVYASARMYATLEGVPYQERFLLETSAIGHDIIQVVGAPDNEERTAEFLEEYLPTIGYRPNEVQATSGIVMATKIPTNPGDDLLKRIICDADVDNLGRDDFFEKTEALRQELGIEDQGKWYEMTLKFMQNHHYYTKSAQRLRQPLKERNMEELIRRLN